MSPELLDPEEFGLKNGRPTEESDCYALGMVIYEVLSGQIPFTKENGLVVIRRVLAGKRPERPPGLFTADLWEMLELCWEQEPRDRPSLKTLLQFLEDTMQASRSPSTSPANEGLATDSLPDPTVTGPNTVFLPAPCNTLDPPSTVRFRPRTPPSLAGRPAPRPTMFTGDYLLMLLRLDMSSPEFPDELCSVLDEGDFYDYITGLEPDNLQVLIEYLDNVRSLHQTQVPVR